jgi:DNA polymerase III delta subunit
LEALINLYGRGLNDDEVSIILGLPDDRHREKMEAHGWQDAQIKEALKLLRKVRT